MSFWLVIIDGNLSLVFFSENMVKLIFQNISVPPVFNNFFPWRLGGTCNFIKKETLAQVFSCAFCEISKNTFFNITPLVAASELLKFITIQNHGMNVFKHNDWDTIATLVKQKGVSRTLSNISDGVFSNTWDEIFKRGLSKYFIDCLPQNVLSPRFNTLPQLLMDFSR